MGNTKSHGSRQKTYISDIQNSIKHWQQTYQITYIPLSVCSNILKGDKEYYFNVKYNLNRKKNEYKNKRVKVPPSLW